jgi:hypothetical protein
MLFRYKKILPLIVAICLGCREKEEKINSSDLAIIQNGPTLEQLLDSIKADSIKFKPIIDSLVFIDSKDSNLIPFLDQCYWLYHVRKLKIVPVFNKRGFSTTEADAQAAWLFEKKTVNCRDLEKTIAEYTGVKYFDSTCLQCFQLWVDPFGHPIVNVLLDKNRDMIFTESYARDGLLGFPRLIKKYHLNYLDEKEISSILKKLSDAPPESSMMGFDGTGISLQASTIGKTFKINRWCEPAELKELWRFIERKIQIKLMKC